MDERCRRQSERRAQTDLAGITEPGGSDSWSWPLELRRFVSIGYGRERRIPLKPESVALTLLDVGRDSIS